MKLMKMGFKMQPLSYITLEKDSFDFKDINVAVAGTGYVGLSIATLP